MKENYSFMEDKLKGEYYDTFKKVDMYAITEGYATEVVDEVMMDLMDLFLEAQNSKKPVDSIVGADINKFCDALFEEYKEGRWKKYFSRMFYGIAWWMVLVELLLLEFDFDSLTQGTPMIGYVCGFGGVIIVSVMMHLVAKPIWMRRKKAKLMLYLIIEFIGSMAVSYLLIYLLGDIDLMLPYWVALTVPTVYIIGYKIVELVKRYKQEGTIRKKKDPDEKSFFRMIDTQARQGFPKEIYNMYRKRNEKKKKKGKNILTPKEFTEKIRRDVKYSGIMTGLSIGVLAAVLLSAIVFNLITYGWKDTLIFTVVLAIAEIPAAFLFYSASLGDKEKKKLLALCDEAGMTLPEYLESEGYDEDWREQEEQKEIEK